MLLDATPFSEIWSALHKDGAGSKAALAVVRFLERRFGAQFVYDSSALPFSDPSLSNLFELADQFTRVGIIKSFGKSTDFYDEPRFTIWNAVCATRQSHIAGGMTTGDERQAFTAALAEALERYIWFEMTDYFVAPMRMTAENAQKFRPIIHPDRFAGFSSEQRKAHPRLALRTDAEYLWIKGHSHTSRKDVWVPAQVVSGSHGIKNAHSKDGEPVILETITTGLATGPTKEFALLGGALEVIERDAFMITWLNQLSPARIDLEALAATSEELSQLLATCKKYRIRIDLVRLPTDAPTFAVCAIAHDESTVGPHVTVGLRADKNLVKAAQGSILEALRIRRTIRYRQGQGRSGEKKESGRVVHLDRADYWAVGDRYKKLAFLTSGQLMPRMHEVWEGDTDKGHLARIVEWCKTMNYEFASVDLGISKTNVSPWQVEMVLLPDLIPMHQDEHHPYTAGVRLKYVPERFGFTPRATSYLDEPHPFA